MPWIDKVPGLLQGWYLGTMGGMTLSDIISGNVNPSGKLPFSFPKKLEDNGAHFYGEISYTGINQSQEYMEDILVGYRWHNTKNILALFPFGHGLSYTAFKYGKPEVSSTSMTSDGEIKITVPVTNIGKVDGKEVVQLYIKDIESTLPRSFKELKGFDKVSLKLGETKNIEFKITEKDLRFFEPQEHKWKAETGNFEALIGSSSTDIRIKVPFKLI